MLYINEREWHVGEPIPYVTGAITLQADGDELELIKKTFKNIPITTKAAVKWTGEIAKFIYLNL